MDICYNKRLKLKIGITMKKVLSLLTFALLLNAAETSCYTVQLLSEKTSTDSIERLLNASYPEDCKVLEVGENIAVRCGCYDGYSIAKAELPYFGDAYPGAIITTSYKGRFKEITKTVKEAPIAPPIVEAKETVQVVNEPIQLQVTKKSSTKKVKKVVYSANALSLENAIEKLKQNNLEIQGATHDVNAAKADETTASGNHWGKLDFIQDVARSNDAGNVFGFKLTSREASFGDFGFSEFDGTNPNILDVQPADLNYPDDRNYFQSKLKYELPIFTGFQISSYSDIMSSMTKMKTLEKKQLVNEKTYQLRKSYYDMALLSSSTTNLRVILDNILKLEDMTQNMIDVGYAKKVDLLEVKAKKGNVERLLVEMNSNKKLLYHYISFLLNEEVNEIILPTAEVVMPNASNEEILKNNLDIQRATTGLSVRNSMVDVSKSSYYPMVGAFGEIATADDSFLGDASDHKAYTVGARLTWNIFNGGIDGAKIEKSKLEQLKTKTQVQLARSGIALQIQKIRTEIASFNEEVNFLEKELALANEIYVNYEGRYKEKLTSMSNVIIKQSEQIEKILQLQMTKNKRNERIFALEKLANGEK